MTASSRNREADRARMVEAQLVRRGIRDVRVLDAMRAVPRERFVDAGYDAFAYEDGALPIAEAQTISQPYVVAWMAEAALLEADDRVLEVGAGSGYAAAVLAHLAASVDAVERHASLAAQAERRLADLGIRNAHVHVGDGTQGWPAAAPFDAIVVSAGGPDVPASLKEQLAIGGRLVIPIGDEPTRQTLRRIVRRDAATYDDEELGDVRFVPLIGAEGWTGTDEGPSSRRDAVIDVRRSLPELVADACEPLPAIDDPRFAAAFDRFAQRRVVLLGEASHGTAEFYEARAAITRRLVERHGFRIVAVEADWPDAASVDRAIDGTIAPRAARDRDDEEPPFQRFPTWMWRNAEFARFVASLRESNRDRAERERVRFYGLDLYNLRASIAAVLRYLDDVDPDAGRIARERYGCLTPWQRDPATYGHAVLNAGYGTCEAAVVAQCRALLDRRLEYAHEGGDRFLDAAQNARLVASAERYYRVMYYGGPESWNLRDTHMFETLAHLLDAHGPSSKAVVWAHNSHIGDARATEMGRVSGELDIGQLCRERFGDDVALVGFGTHTGTVAAASDWDAPMQAMRVRESREDSVERVMHDTRIARFLLPLTRHTDGGASTALRDVVRERLREDRLERFIGVIYRPQTEVTSHYAHVSLSEQFDAYVWFDETRAVTPLTARATHDDVPDTYPFGM